VAPVGKDGGKVTKRRFELLIFDCDGVLVDSEVITNRVFVGMLNELGLALSLEDMFERFVGRSMPQCLTLIRQLLGREVPEEFLPEFQLRITAALESELKAVDGIESVLETIKLPYCVASSGTHAKMRLTLGLTGLLPNFEGRMFSVTEVALPKPFPDVFLHAAMQLNTAAAACAVIEDTPTGVRAGVAAGMTVFGFCAHTPKHRLLEAGAHHIFDNMRDLPRLLRA
jgi:HAD superfamily hydrolase (TIGR01509 family)